MLVIGLRIFKTQKSYSFRQIQKEIALPKTPHDKVHYGSDDKAKEKVINDTGDTYEIKHLTTPFYLLGKTDGKPISEKDLEKIRLDHKGFDKVWRITWLDLEKLGIPDKNNPYKLVCPLYESSDRSTFEEFAPET